MTKQQASRLLTLAWFLRGVDRKNFDMSSYASKSGRLGGPVAAVHEVDRATQPICGTTACALGWATQIWPDEFRLVFTGDDDVSGLECNVGNYWCWTAYDNWNVLDFFGIASRDDARYLFGGQHRRRTPTAEAAVIEQYVRDHGWEYA